MSERPNILFLQSDQHRWDALGCVNPIVQTPNLDALAARGIRFDQAVCNIPMCVPSRYSMMMGLYGSLVGYRHNTTWSYADADLPAPVLPQMMADAGYQTAGFGKTHWYIGYRMMPEIEPEHSTRGFQHRVLQSYLRPENGDHEEPAILQWDEEREWVQELEAERMIDGVNHGGESVIGYKGFTSGVPGQHHAEGYLTRKCLDWLDKGRDPQRPFFLYLSFDKPHAANIVPPGYEERYNLADIPERLLPPWGRPDEFHVPMDRRAEDWSGQSSEAQRLCTLRYYALCTYVDELYGQVLAKLGQLGELDNTLILFTADHGEMLGDRGHRFSKYSLYDDSIRVPLIVAGPQVPYASRGTVDHRPAELVDVVPTLMHAVGEDHDPTSSGISLFRKPEKRGTFTEMHGSGYETLQHAPAYCWRSDGWKLIVYMDGDLEGAFSRVGEASGELYNLDADPEEWTNLWNIQEYAPRREQLLRELLMHLAVASARYPQRCSRAHIAS